MDEGQKEIARELAGVDEWGEPVRKSLNLNKDGAGRGRKGG